MRPWQTLLFVAVVIGGCGHAQVLEAPVMASAPPEPAPPPPLPEPRREAPSVPRFQRPQARTIRRSRDPRPSVKPRRDEVIATEIRIYEARLRMLDSWDPSRLDLTRDIAEDYVEQGSSPVVGLSAHLMALIHYETLLRASAYPLKDEVRYYRALQYERVGNIVHAHTIYLEIIASNSTFTPYAHFGVGEILREQSKFDDALRAYSLVLHSVANPLEPDAILRIGQVHEAKGERNLAGPMFRQLLRLYPTSDAAAEVPAWARVP